MTTLALPHVDTLEAAYDDGQVRVYHADHATLAEALRGAGVDAVITDCPYSKRTHSGHAEGAVTANRAADFATRSAGQAKDRRYAAKLAAEGRSHRREIEYPHWTHSDVEAFVDLWTPLVRGWFVSLTDEDLAPTWRGSYLANDRLGFQSIPCVERGMTVRMCGGGPSSWSTWGQVSRPRSLEWARWPTLPGAYSGPAEEKPWVGGKPVWLIRALVRDYSRPGDLIVDPCCGAGTLGVAVRYEGRRAILADKDPAAVETTIRRLRGERTKATRDDFPESPSQPSLFGRTA